MVYFFPIQDKRLTQIRKATEQDEVCDQLRKIIVQGWPTEKMDLSAVLHPYFHTRDKISVNISIWTYLQEQPKTHPTLWSDLKRTIHSSHINRDRCLQCARECVFRPGMSTEIRAYISSCETRCKFMTKQPKETLMPHDILDQPWEKVGIDLFESDTTDYLITIDYFSKFWEIDRLENTTASTIIHKMKIHFVGYGIACQDIPDAGPQLTSSAFWHFSENGTLKPTVSFCVTNTLTLTDSPESSTDPTPQHVCISSLMIVI